MRAVGPAVARRQLGAELRRLRIGAGLDIAAVAAALQCSGTRVSRIETAKGRTSLRATELEQLCDLYGVTDADKRTMLQDMRTGSQKSGWWEQFEDVLPSGLDVLVGLETDARAVLAWEPLLVHGLLQTPAYARAVLGAGVGILPRDADALVQLRMARQELLTRAPAPLELWVILDEAVLRRPVGGPAVMHEQLLHLATAADRTAVTVQVLPLRKGAHWGLSGAFALIECDESATIGYVDSPAGNLYVERRADVRRLQSTLDLLRASALDPTDSVALLRDIAEEWQQ
ncbi:helix-turn-helix domain-containing protein [Streptomyces harbinensis]